MADSTESWLLAEKVNEELSKEVSEAGIKRVIEDGSIQVRNK